MRAEKSSRVIRKSWLLITAIAAGQFVCTAGGVLWFTAWQDRIWRDTLQEQFVTQNVLVTAQTAAKVAREFNLTAEGPAACEQRRRLQQFVESISLPKRWYLSVIDENGMLIADPRLQSAPELARTRPGHWLLQRPEGARPLHEALAEAPEGSVSGWVQMADGIHLIAAQAVPEANVAVLAHQHAGALEALPAAIVAPIRRMGLLIGVVLTFLTGGVTRLLVGRYEHKLAVLNAQLQDKVQQRGAALLQMRDAVIFGLAKLADSRDRQTGEHLDRLQRLAGLLANELRRAQPLIDAAWVERLRLAAPLHDIGKVGIPDAILLKPGPLTPAEREIMQRHAEIGAECLAAIGVRLGENDFLAMAREIALCHHERWDGTGYPRGLRGQEIPLAARIVALADVYDAATSARIYKPAQSHEAIRDVIVANRGQHFEPAVVDAFLRVEASFRRQPTERRPPPVALAFWPTAEIMTAALDTDAEPCPTTRNQMRMPV